MNPSPLAHGLSIVQSKRKIIFSALYLLLIIALLFQGQYWTHSVHHLIESIGVMLIVSCVVGRTWVSAYILGSKGHTLVSQGPYSVCRNPLYFFSILGGAGIGGLSGSLIALLIVGLVTAALFSLLIRVEEQTLTRLHGENFSEYAARVPRLLPSPSLYADATTGTLQLAGVYRTFLDSCWFLIAIPIAETLELLKHHKLLPTLVALP